MSAVLAIDGAQNLSCEVLVIGTGAGGASVAATLAQAGANVLMLEEGPYIPASEAPAGLSRAMLKMWRGGGLLTTLGSQVAFAEGRCVGGGTEINSAIFQATPDHVLKTWAAANGIGDFTPAGLKPYFERAGAVVNASLTPGPAGPPTDILARAGHAMGWQVSELERGQRNCVGTNLCSAACPTGGKQSMTATLIPQALAQGARLLPQARVRKLMVAGARVTGAQAHVTGGDGQQHNVTISAETVFVCAGTTQTPALLARSGIRSEAGRSFQLHPTIRLLARFAGEINAQRYRLPLAAITEFMPELRFGGSVFTLPTYGMAMAEDWKNRADRLPDYARHAIYYAMIKPDGVGRIHTIPGVDEPVTSYALTERDRRRLWRGAQTLAQGLFAAGAEHVTPSVVGHQGWKDAGAAAGDCAIPPAGRTNLMTIHLFASCPMGEKAGIHAVDSLGRLRRHENVIVADGSVLPGAPGVNPQATIMALSMRSADAWLSPEARMIALLELMRPRQWIKNGFVLAPLFFGADLLHRTQLLHALTATAVFCLVSSAVYIFNDWRDMEADRVHAKKKGRPLASGRISVAAALGAMLALLAGAAAIVLLGGLPRDFGLILILYLAINLAYSLGLKQVGVIELFLVSSGFILRLLGGGVALAVTLSPWIVIATGTIALLMATGKRRGDIARRNDVQGARKSLAGYNLAFLDSVLSALAGATLVVYLLFCVSDYAVGRYGQIVLVTAVPVAAGLIRYLQLIIVYEDGESPSDLVLRDRGLFSAVVILIAIFSSLIYLR